MRAVILNGVWLSHANGNDDELQPSMENWRRGYNAHGVKDGEGEGGLEEGRN